MVTLAFPDDGPHGGADWRATRSGLDRRRDAACRLAPFECGCSDPWRCRCGRGSGEPDGRVVDVAVRAFEHLESHGLPPMVAREDKPLLRGMWWQKGPRRGMAERVAKWCGIERG
ncbi:conserved hypothetical protein [Segniliparus rotundus DSM 44985]|uniref:Uncharacterized protein n=1 Tax=Segniliparus rotundus (strain ATCC BAA-972 / CDC 1076 / CIP 108378 / DSM 44985 / JCM 13578) TaxID=640132 RepID=D6ZEY9_SEGRD|nr:hypothetical protein [Segniliparus rotundus]ADG97513.1 conserved hypothetical protein [Segniliparus rotundus DSM 44985]